LVDDVLADARLELPEGADRFVIYTYGEPALLFQMRLAGATHVVPVMSLALAHEGARPSRIASYVVIGPHALATSGFAQDFERARDRLEPVSRQKFRVSPLVSLDRRDDRGPGMPVNGEELEFELFRVLLSDEG
jgi:hypothetical protein